MYKLTLIIKFNLFFKLLWRFKKTVFGIEIDKNLSLIKVKKDICVATMQKALEFFETKVELKKNENIGEFTIFIY